MSKHSIHDSKSEEIKYLVFRYLQERGFKHTAYVFDNETHVNNNKVDTDQIPSVSLLSLVQKGVNYVQIEQNKNNKEKSDKGTAAASASEDTKSLYEAHKCFHNKKNFRREKPVPPLSGSSNSRGRGKRTGAEAPEFGSSISTLRNITIDAGSAARTETVVSESGSESNSWDDGNRGDRDEIERHEAPAFMLHLNFP
eukprot:IDg4192t1